MLSVDMARKDSGIMVLQQHEIWGNLEQMPRDCKNLSEKIKLD